MHISDIIGIIILSTLYFLQGVALGLPLGSLPIILVEKGATYAELSAISLSGFPFSFKILWASFLDKYFIKSFGKRKTYIVPCKYIIGILYLIYSSYVDDDINNLNITPIATVLLITIILEATADIAVDGWVLTILSEENVALGPTCQSVGQNLGWFLSQFIFVQITSVKFANDYIYTTPSDQPLISYGAYFKFWGIFTLIVTFLIHFFKKEVNPTTREFKSIWEVYSTLKGFYHNKNLRFLCAFLLVYKAGFAFMDPAGFLQLVKKGFPKETLTTIGILAYPIQFIAPIWVAKYNLKKMELQMVFKGIFVSIVFTIGMMLTVNLYQNGSGDGGWILYLIAAMAFTNQIGKIIMEVSSASFNTRICDPSVGGTFITALASVANVHRTIIQPLGLTVLDFVNFFAANAIGVAYEIYLSYKLENKCIQLQEAPKEIWNLEHVSGEHGDYVEMKEKLTLSPGKKESDSLL